MNGHAGVSVGFADDSVSVPKTTVIHPDDFDVKARFLHQAPHSSSRESISRLRREHSGGCLGKMRLNRGRCYALLIVVAVLSLGFWWFWPRIFIDESRPLYPPLHTGADRGGQTTDNMTTDRVRIDAYVESQCPDTSDFLTNELDNVMKKLGTRYVDLHLYAFGKAGCTASSNGGYSCHCQHGRRECDMNQLQDCVLAHYPDLSISWPVILCLQGRDVNDGEQCTKLAQLPWHTLKQCALGTEGQRLQYEAGEATKRMTGGSRLRFVPWVVLNGRHDDNLLHNLFSTVCAAMRRKPAVCQ